MEQRSHRRFPLPNLDPLYTSKYRPLEDLIQSYLYNNVEAWRFERDRHPSVSPLSQTYNAGSGLSIPREWRTSLPRVNQELAFHTKAKEAETQSSGPLLFAGGRHLRAWAGPRTLVGIVSDPDAGDG